MTADSQLPQPADGSPAGGGAAPTGKAPGRAELQAEVERSRAELGATIDALTAQLTVGYQARRASRVAREAASDAGSFVTGAGLPGDHRRARNVKVLFGSAAVVAAVVTFTVVRRVVGRAGRSA